MYFDSNNSKDGYTLLHMAVEADNEMAIKILVEVVSCACSIMDN